MDRELLRKYIEEDKLTTKQISALVGLSDSTVSYWVQKFGLQGELKYHKNPNFVFGKIDTIEKAYAIGFVACDAAISTAYDVEIAVAKSDSAVIDYLSRVFMSNKFTDNALDMKKRKFPNVYTQKRISDVLKFVGDRKKAARHLPIVPKELNRYMILGAFDADGCITWGHRKDRGRIWHKVSFTSSLGILTCIQNILIKELGIASTIRPKGNEKCFVLEFSNVADVVRFMSYLYQDNFCILQRKRSKYNALRLELEENGGTQKWQYRA